VDMLDFIRGKYSVDFRTRRWPMKVLYYILDTTAANAAYLHATGNRVPPSVFRGEEI
jgi:hypothetical protein